jgi:hypothetical protein
VHARSYGQSPTLRCFSTVNDIGADVTGSYRKRPVRCQRPCSFLASSFDAGQVGTSTCKTCSPELIAPSIRLASSRTAKTETDYSLSYEAPGCRMTNSGPGVGVLTFTIAPVSNLCERCAHPTVPFPTAARDAQIANKVVSKLWKSYLRQCRCEVGKAIQLLARWARTVHFRNLAPSDSVAHKIDAQSKLLCPVTDEE